MIPGENDHSEMTLIPIIQRRSTLYRRSCSSYKLTWHLQYNFIAKCQYKCTRDVLWCQVHSSHIHTNHKTDYKNSRQTFQVKSHLQTNKMVSWPLSLNHDLQGTTPIYICQGHFLTERSIGRSSPWLICQSNGARRGASANQSQRLINRTVNALTAVTANKAIQLESAGVFATVANFSPLLRGD